MFRRGRRTVTVLGTAAAAAVLAACGGSSAGSSTGSSASDAQGVSSSKVVIGIPGPLTGPASFVGQGFEAGAKFAAQQINDKGGVDGRKIEFDVIDTKADPAAGLTALRKMIQQDKVFGILSAQTSTESVAAAPMLRQAKIPYISLGSDPKIFTPAASNLFSGSSTREDVKATESADFVKTLNLKTLAITVANDAHSQQGAPIFIKAVEGAGIKIVSKTDHAVADTSFTAQVHQMIGAHPDAIYIYSLGGPAGHIIKEIRTQGYKGQIIGDSGSAVLSTITIAGAKNAEGFYSTWYPTTDAPGDAGGNTEKFDKAFLAANPQTAAGLPNIYTYMGYQDAYVLAEGMRTAGKKLSWDGLIKALETMNGFVAGKGTPQWPDAIPIGSPRTFTADNHAGSTFAMEVIARGGQFQSVSK